MTTDEFIETLNNIECSVEFRRTVMKNLCIRIHWFDSNEMLKQYNFELTNEESHYVTKPILYEGIIYKIKQFKKSN